MMSTKQTRINVALIIALVTIEYAGFSITLTSLTPYFITSEKHFLSPTLQPYATIILGCIFAMPPLAEFCFSTFFGQYSDKFGRKKVCMGLMSIGLTSYFLTGISLLNHSLTLMLISRFMAGISGCSIPIAQSSMADISDKQHRALAINWVEIAVGSGWVFGPILGSYLPSQQAYWVLGIVTVCVFLCFPLFKETVIKTQSNAKFKFRQSIHALRKHFQNRSLKLAVIIWLVFMFGWLMYVHYFPAMMYNKMHISQKALGNLFSMIGIIYFGYQLWWVRFISKRYTPKQLLPICMFFSSLSITFFAFSPNVFDIEVLLFPYLAAMSLVVPNFMAFISIHARDDIQGEMLGTVNSLMSLMNIFVLLIGGLTLTFASDYPVLLGGAMMLLGTMLFCKTKWE